MDVKRILAELRGEQSRITRAVAALEAISNDGIKRSLSTTPKRRRRGRMTAAGRKRLSELMKKRWAQGKMKRKAKAA
ncbi:MAG: hypothetical protein ABSG52_09450 [Terriglobales bacterium]|jgi:hypothetical protein